MPSIGKFIPGATRRSQTRKRVILICVTVVMLRSLCAESVKSIFVGATDTFPKLILTRFCQKNLLYKASNAFFFAFFLAFSKHLMKYTVNAGHQVRMFTWNLICVFFWLGTRRYVFCLQIFWDWQIFESHILPCVRSPPKTSLAARAPLQSQPS